MDSQSFSKAAFYIKKFFAAAFKRIFTRKSGMNNQLFKIKESDPKKLVAELKEVIGRGTISANNLADHIAKIQEKSQLETPAAKYAFFEELVTQFNLTSDNHKELILLLIKKEQEINEKLKSNSTLSSSLKADDQKN